jgi:hypothetical protein
MDSRLAHRRFRKMVVRDDSGLAADDLRVLAAPHDFDRDRPDLDPQNGKGQGSSLLGFLRSMAEGRVVEQAPVQRWHHGDPGARNRVLLDRPAMAKESTFSGEYVPHG